MCPCPFCGTETEPFLPGDAITPAQYICERCNYHWAQIEGPVCENCGNVSFTKRCHACGHVEDDE